MRRKLMVCASAMLAPGIAAGAHAASLDAPAARAAIDGTLDRIYPSLDALYKDIHQHPELGFQEQRTAALLAKVMRNLGFTVTEQVGKTGIVAVYRNGDGPVVMVRTELDALPLEEKTGLAYASRAQQLLDGKPTFVDHACGHDIHMAWWVGTAQALLAMKDSWHGTLVFVGQPAEEVIGGAKAMLADGLYSRFPKPDYAFAAHVGPQPMGAISVKQGVVTSAADTVMVTFHGVGAHGSMPDKGIDPIVEGAHFVTDVQTVISRQKDAQKFGVITVGSFNAGFAPNIIPDTAELKLTLRSFDPDVRELLLRGVTTSANAVAEMAGAPAPDIKHPDGVAAVVNDSDLAARTAGLFSKALGADRVTLISSLAPGSPPSEDYSEFVAAGVPHSVFFSVGGSDPKMLAEYQAAGKPVPVNHSPFFAPVPEPTIRAGVEILALAVLSVTEQ